MNTKKNMNMDKDTNTRFSIPLGDEHIHQFTFETIRRELPTTFPSIEFTHIIEVQESNDDISQEYFYAIVELDQTDSFTAMMAYPNWEINPDIEVS